MGRVENVDDKIGAIAALAANKDEQKQKDLFGEFYQAYNQSRPLFQKAETTLMKIERLNEDISSSSVDEAWRRDQRRMGDGDCGRDCGGGGDRLCGLHHRVRSPIRSMRRCAWRRRWRRAT
jgi:hypothetical protein